MYGKLINGELEIAPRKLINGDFMVYNPPESLYLTNGYYPIEFTEEPTAPEGYYYESGWEQQENSIVQTWILTELPNEIDDAEAWQIIFGGNEE